MTLKLTLRSALHKAPVTREFRTACETSLKHAPRWPWPIIDAGPGLNFLFINRERLLIAVLGELSAPETVQDEVFRKSAQDSRFRAAATVWRKLTPR